jgi:ubiquinone/menaquinone biosynthesis C-methylase UbiE
MFLKPAQIIEDLKIKGYLLQGFVVGDFGCGSGYFTSLFAQAVGPSGKVKAVDIQEEELKGAEEFVRQTGQNNVDFILADLEEKVPLDDNSLDLVFISQVLFQSEKPEAILKEAYRTLKRGRYLVVIEPDVEHTLFQGQKTFTKKELEDLIVAQNFEIKETKLTNGFHIIIAQK